MSRVVHLDTSFLIRALVPGTREDQRLREWLTTEVTVEMSVIGWAEFLCGPVDEHQTDLVRQLLRPPVALLEADAQLGARLFSETGRRRGSLADCLLAATALRAGASFATTNVNDFNRFGDHGLQLAAS
jgi:predicted nucleic acid-binding protein